MPVPEIVLVRSTLNRRSGDEVVGANTRGLSKGFYTKEVHGDGAQARGRARCPLRVRRMGERMGESNDNEQATDGSNDGARGERRCNREGEVARVNEPREKRRQHTREGVGAKRSIQVKGEEHYHGKEGNEDDGTLRNKKGCDGTWREEEEVERRQRQH